MDRNTTFTVHPGNNSQMNSTCSRDNVLKTVVFPVLYSLLFLVGVTLNAVAVWIFFRIPSKSHFIIYLKNIVVADVIMTFTFPFKVLSDSNMASVGLRVFVCRVSSVLFYLSMYISILFFGLISIDRCRKTLNPFRRTNSIRLARRKILSGIIWTLLLVLCLPNVILTNKTPKSHSFKCSDLKTQAGLNWHEVVNYTCQVIFWGNLATVMVCYALISKELIRSYNRTKSHQQNQGEKATGLSSMTPKSKNAKTKFNVNVFIVLGVFAVCFMPFHFARVPYTISQTRVGKFDCAQKLSLFQMKEITLFLTSLNSVLDPVIYFVLCKSFRMKLFKSLHLPLGTCRRLTGRSSDYVDTSESNVRDSKE